MDNYSQFTISISLEKYGIKNAQEIIHNPSFEFLYNEELNILNQQKNENWKKIKIKTLIPVNLFISNQEGILFIF